MNRLQRMVLSSQEMSYNRFFPPLPSLIPPVTRPVSLLRLRYIGTDS